MTAGVEWKEGVVGLEGWWHVWWNVRMIVMVEWMRTEGVDGMIVVGLHQHWEYWSSSPFTLWFYEWMQYIQYWQMCLPAHMSRSSLIKPWWPVYICLCKWLGIYQPSECQWYILSRVKSFGATTNKGVTLSLGFYFYYKKWLLKKSKHIKMVPTNTQRIKSKLNGIILNGY